MALVDGPGYCDKHKSEASGWNRGNAKTGNRHAKGYGTAWDKLRETILRRDNGLCQACLAEGRVTPATHVDHIMPKAKGGTDDPANLQSMCATCHHAKTARERGQGGGGSKP